MRDRAAAVRTAVPPKIKRCPACHQEVVDLDDPCPTCETKRLAKARMDRRAEFYDHEGNQLTVRLVQSQLHEPWRVFVEFKPKKKVERTGMRADFSEDERPAAVVRFGELVQQALQRGWRPVVAPWDVKLVNPLAMDQAEV